MQKIQVLLKIDELSALGRLACRERRDTPSQAAWLIRQELKRQGLLKENEQPIPTMEGRPRSGGANVY